MALEQYSLAALINQQMAASGAALNTVPSHSVGAAYFWNVLGVELRKARPSRAAVSLPREARAGTGGAVRMLEMA